MDFPEDHRWFKELKANRTEFTNVENIIEITKLKYEKENHLTEWILGIGIAIFLSLSIADLLKSSIVWIRNTGIIGYIIVLLMIFISMCIQVRVIGRQKIAMSYLYREKDKQETLRKKFVKK